MFSKWQLAVKYLKYYLSASNGKGHGTHSPFIFHFIKKILNEKDHYPEYDTVEELRKRLLNDQTVLTIADLGAGSSMHNANRRSVASIAHHSAKRKKLGQLLFRIAKEYQPQTILELGTSLGITSSYLSLAAPGARVITIEGASEVAAVADKNFKDLGIQNISVVQGNFDEVLSGTISEIKKVDLAFIDGNHRQEPTERYFHEILPALHNDSILVFDDIHWSPGMERAWETIKSHPSVRCSIDLFFMGGVFFRQEFREKQHFSIRF